jgi:hypothetical protein
MEVDLFGAGAEGQHLVHVCHQFLRGAGTTGVVAGAEALQKMGGLLQGKRAGRRLQPRTK